MIHFEGEKAFPHPLPEVAAKLSDAGFLVGCIPDAQVTLSTPDKVICKLKPKLAFLSGSLDITLESTGREAEKSASFKVFSKAIGATSTVTASLAFREGDAGTTAVHWSGDLVELTGLLKLVPKGLLQATANKIIEDVWAEIAKKMG